MTIQITIDNDLATLGSQPLTLDETAGVQTGADASGADNDVAVAYSAGSVTSANLDAAFLAYLNGLFPAGAVEDAALGFTAAAEGASSTNTFIQVATTAGEAVNDLFFSINTNVAPGMVLGQIPGMFTLADEPLYFHIDADTDFATVTTAAGAGGRIVAAFYLDEAADHLSAQVQMVTFEAIKHPDGTNPDDALAFTDVLQISAAGSSSFDFDELPSGNFLWVAIGSTSAGLLVTGNDLNVNDDAASGQYGSMIAGGSNDPSDTMNTSQGGAGATIGVNSQHFVAGKVQGKTVDGPTAVFTLVTGYDPFLLSAGQATGTNVQDIQYSGYINTVGAGLFISQLTGTHADLRVSLLEADGDAAGGLQPEEGFAYIGNQDTDSALNNDAEINVGTVTVFRNGVELHTFAGTGTSNGITVTFGSGATSNEFTITGLHALDTVSWTADNDTFNRFKVQALSTTDAFDVGRVDIQQGVSVSAGLGSHLLVDDDGPSASETGTVPTLTVDETNLGTDATNVAITNLFTTGYGTDGAGTTVHTLNAVEGANSGLVDTATNQSVFLFKVGATVVGKAGVDAAAALAGSATVFVVSVNASTGALSLDQQRAIVHPTTNPDESKNLTGSDLITLTVTVTDKDGDIATETADLTQKLVFKDDGPTLAASATQPTLTVDETSLATNSSNDFSTVFTPTYGADAAGSVGNYLLGVTGGANVASGLTDTALNVAVVLNVESGQVVGRAGIGGPIVFTVSVNSSGNVTLDQIRAVVHASSSDPDESRSLSADNLVTLTATVTDKDGDTNTAMANIGLNLVFKDDGPTADLADVTNSVDDDGGAGGNPGGPGDDLTSTRVATGSVTPIFAAGADGLGSFTMTLDTANLSTSLKSQGGTVLYDVTGNTLTAYVNGAIAGYTAADDREVFTFNLNGATGGYTFTLIDQLDNPTAGTEDELNIQLGVLLRVVDKDGDTATASLTKLVIVADDDSPVIIAPAAPGDSFDVTYDNDQNPTPGGTGYFSYAIGFDDRDTYASNNTDLLVTFTGGTVGGTAVTNRDIDWVSEDDNEATFDFSFTYVSDPTNNTTTNAAGTLIFDKDAGTYHISLTEPVSSFSIISLADAGVGFTGYALNSATLKNSQPPVTVAALDDDFFVQFTGREETGGGSDGNSASQQNAIANNHNLDALAINGAWSNPGDDGFVDGEVFTQSSTWVSVSGTAAGVAGDTMQAGEVLDFNFFKDNPQGFLSPAGIDKATTSTIFIKFDALDNGEDLVVLLKLVDKDDPSITTTRAVIVQYDDIFHKAQAGEIPVSFGFTGTLDNNDGLVVIERNDYNINVGDNWTIEGAQVLASTEALTGVGIDLNRAIGANGGSTLNGTDPFNTVKDSGGNNGGTWDGDVFKIVNIGFFTETTPDAQLTFGVQVVDFDGDTTASQTLTVDILGDSSASATQQVVNLLEVPEPGLFLM